MKQVTSVTQRIRQRIHDLRQPRASDTDEDVYATHAARNLEEQLDRMAAADADSASNEELEAAERIIDEAAQEAEYQRVVKEMDDEDLELESVSHATVAEPEYRQGVKKDAKGIMSGKCPDCGGRLSRDIVSDASITFACAGKRDKFVINAEPGCGYKAEVLLSPGELDEED